MKSRQLALAVALAASGTVYAAGPDTEVVEFYNTVIGHYFITGSARDVRLIEEGAAGAGWVKTGRTFQAWSDPTQAPPGAVPADAFRLGRVACFQAGEDVARFQTSGTTGGAGVHFFRTLDTYRQLSVVWGRHQLLRRSSARCTVLGARVPLLFFRRELALLHRECRRMRGAEGAGSRRARAHERAEGLDLGRHRLRQYLQPADLRHRHPDLERPQSG